MKKLKVIFVLCLLTAGVISSNAQVSFGVKGGLNTSTLSGYSDLIKSAEGMEGMEGIEIGDVKTMSKLGFHVGVMAQLNLPVTNLFLQPELLYSSLGVKTEYEGESENSSLNYIQLPVYVGYKINAGLGLDVILGAGPYLGYGLSGDEDAFDIFNRFDFGLSAMAGIQYNKLQITAAYDLGLTDNMGINGWKTAKDLYGLSGISNRNIKVSLGYFF